MDLCETAYQRIEAEVRAIFTLLGVTPGKKVVLDFHKTDVYGSTALAFFVNLWKRVRASNGRVAFCNVSDHEKEILRITRLDQLWPICTSRNEAIEVVRDGSL